MPYCRWSQSLGELNSDALTAWGTQTYEARFKKEPTVFFGLYDFRDYWALWRHKGKTWVFFAGSDLCNLADGFIFNDGKLGFLSRFCKGWFSDRIKDLVRSREVWVENLEEAKVCQELGIKVSGVCPSFMGKLDYPISFQPALRPAAYISAGKGRGKEYGFDTLCRVAYYLPWIDFHLYGDDWSSSLPNVHCHGHVPKAVFSEQTAKMHIALSLNEFCGFSEVVARGILQGHYAVSKVEHPLIDSYRDEMDLISCLNRLGKKKVPNLKVCQWYRNNLNKFPWSH